MSANKVKTRGFSSRKLAGTAVLTALSLISFLLEGLLPPMFIPGAKLGLGNIFTMLALIVYSPASAFAAVAVKCIVGNLIAGSLSSMIYSLAAGLIGMCVSSLSVRLCPRISVTAVCVASAVIHNTVQCLVFCAVSATWQAAAYLPYLVMLGALSGTAVGAAVTLLLKKVPICYFAKLDPDIGYCDNIPARDDKTQQL